jgi:transcriptional regulator with XRE-family HTH domain
MTLAERAVLRIREEMTERKISQRTLADRLGCSQGRVAKLLNGGVMLRLEDVGVLAAAVGITVVEALRDRGVEFYAELSPSEVRLLDRLRRRPQALQGALLMLGLPEDVPKPKHADAKRRTTKPK